ncbi:hypothetical protein ACH46_07685 [Gordonia phthalatica]|uniref:Uncharacterized protein n=1 Tax=Gordonia phthalatica TaxID=1136941 RepID=A0A0N9NGD0_9ACTN|nr:hypothetical protein ACH46_07685 [Gordonia phthalatica]
MDGRPNVSSLVWINLNNTDFAICRPESAHVLDVHHLYHKNAISPYDGRALAGVVKGTWLRGQKIDFQNPLGRMLRRGDV